MLSFIIKFTSGIVSLLSTNVTKIKIFREDELSLTKFLFLRGECEQFYVTVLLYIWQIYAMHKVCHKHYACHTYMISSWMMNTLRPFIIQKIIKPYNIFEWSLNIITYNITIRIYPRTMLWCAQIFIFDRAH